MYIWADVKPTHKKGSRTDKENYRPISILRNISKIYERCVFNQLTILKITFLSASVDLAKVLV